MEKIKKTKKRIALKVIAVIFGLWVLITAIDAIRFFTSDKQISPIIRTEYNSCKCYEWCEEVGIGYVFDYSYDSIESHDAKKPDRAVYKFYFFGMEDKMQYERK
ncbi:MAG: hypothetical protein K2K14_06550 [Ruminococcus sp.]|nr:hypothetical protein [Ruminococcus sp.]